MKARVEEWSDQYDYHFSIYSTPSESLTDRFCRLDTEKFGKVPDITDKEYYTNSFHYDVRKNPTPFEKLDFEKVYPEAGASGGFIHYCEYPVLQQNPKALEAVWDYAYDRVGYLGTNTPIDRCYKCDFEDDGRRRWQHTRRWSGGSRPCRTRSARACGLPWTVRRAFAVEIRHQRNTAGARFGSECQGCEFVVVDAEGCTAGVKN